MASASNIVSKLTAPKKSSSRSGVFGVRKKKKKEEVKIPLSCDIQKIKSEKNTLYIIRNPDEKCISFLQKKYVFHPIHLDDIKSPLQRPKIDLEDHYIFFVVHFPQFNSKTKRVEVREIDFFLTDNDVVAILDEEFEPMEKLIKKISKEKAIKKDYFEKGAGFLLYSIIEKLVDSIFPILGKMEKIVEQIDQRLFSEQSQNVLEDTSFLRRNVIYFQTQIKPELNYFTAIEEMEHYLLDEDTKIYFSNISDHLKKIWDRLEDVKELIDNLSTTFESYFSFKTNETIKVLTIFSVILMPLTLLSGIYGMNLSFLPLASHPMGLFIITLFMIFTVISMVVVFKIKKWI